MSRIRYAPLALLAVVSLALLLAVIAAPAAAPAAAQGLPTPTWRFDFLRQWAHQPPPGIFNIPWGIAFDSSGNLYVVDQGNHRVQVLDRTGQAVRTLGHLGAGPGELYFPLRVAVDGQGTVYVTDAGNQRVVRFAADGTPLPSWEGFEGLNGIGVGSDGAVYVTDNVGRWPTSRGRLHKFSDAGATHTILQETPGGFGGLKVKRELGGDILYILVPTREVDLYNANGWLVGRTTLPDLQTAYPFDLEVDNAGNLYLTDQDADAMAVRSGRDGVLRQWSGFASPRGVALGPDGLVYVTDGMGGNYGTGRSTAMRIQRLTPGGAVVEPTWGSEEGHAPGQLVNPDGIAWDPAGYVWVHNGGDGRFLQFTPEGDLVRETPLSADFRGAGDFAIDHEGNLLVGGPCLIYKLSPMGEVLREYRGSEPPCITTEYNPHINFTHPHGFDLDSQGNLYVADPSNQRVVRLDRDGHIQKAYGDESTLTSPRDAALDERNGHLYVLDWQEVTIGGLNTISTRIQVYALADGRFETTWIVPNVEPTWQRDSAYVYSIEVDKDGYVYADDGGTNTVWKLEPPKGVLVARIEPGGYGAGPGQFDDLPSHRSFTVDDVGKLYTVETTNGRVQVFAQVQTTATATPTATATSTSSPTPTTTATASPTALATATATATATTSPSPTATAVASPSPTPGATPTATVTPPPVETRHVVFVPYVVR